MDPYVGQLCLVPYTFAPRGWAFCQGQLLPISQNTALYSLLGTNFGGDGRSTFALPNLQGSVATGTGTGPGLSSVVQGQAAGEAAVTLTGAMMPAHTHFQQGSASAGAGNSPVNAVFAETPGGKGKAGPPFYQVPPQPANYSQMASTAIGPNGSSQPHSNLMPYLVLNWIISLQGVYPSRQ